MEEYIPADVNKRRRKILIRNTLIGFLVYQCPMIAWFISALTGLIYCDMIIIHIWYLSILLANAGYIVMILLKKEMTHTFISFVLFVEIAVWYVLMNGSLFFLGDLRVLMLISSLLALIYVFSLAGLIESVVTIGIVIVTYLSVSYIAVSHLGHDGSFMKEVLYILVYAPAALLILYRSNLIKIKNSEIKQNRNELMETYKDLESVHERLEVSHQEIENYNTRLVESLHYAEMIQRSILPGVDRLKSVVADNFIIWIPKDIVGGDIFYTYTDKDMAIITLMDCTGHGVPGAFMTMIASSETRKIIKDEGCHDPAEVLKNLNQAVKKALSHEEGERLSDDGLDAAVCLINKKEMSVLFSGAKMDLYYIKEDYVHVIKGDRHSLGYQNSRTDFIFTNHLTEEARQCVFYLATDGITDQLGGEPRRRFGTSRFKKLLLEIHKKPIDRQREIIIETLTRYQGDHDRQDDISVIGFKL